MAGTASGGLSGTRRRRGCWFCFFLCGCGCRRLCESARGDETPRGAGGGGGERGGAQAGPPVNGADVVYEGDPGPGGRPRGGGGGGSGGAAGGLGGPAPGVGPERHTGADRRVARPPLRG